MIRNLDPNGEGLDPTLTVYNTSGGGGIGRNMVFDADGSYIEYDDFRAEALRWFDDHFLDVFGT